MRYIPSFNGDEPDEDIKTLNKFLDGEDPSEPSLFNGGVVELQNGHRYSYTVVDPMVVFERLDK